MGRAGRRVRKPRARCALGAIVYAAARRNGRYTLKQTPEMQGALVAMDPHTGRVLAMVGGYSFNEVGGLNRATQARRQPGSAFKPIVYAAALEFGLTPATLVDDGPLGDRGGRRHQLVARELHAANIMAPPPCGAGWNFRATP